MKLLAALALSAGLAATGSNPLHYPQPPNQPNEFYVFVEIPVSSAVKYEADHETGHVIVDRFISMPMAYPANYGSVTSSLQRDGDPLDALVITRMPLHPGVLVLVRALGVLRMVDDEELDDKIITVPAHGLDSSFDHLQALEDLPEMERKRLRAFFETYELLSDNEIVVGEFEDAAVARRLVSDAIARFEAWKKSTRH